jgi:hypothetical protein
MAGKPDCRDAGVTVSFATGSYELNQNGKGALDGVATWMKANPDRTLHLEGYADTTGNSEANMVLSEHRADAVKDYLVSVGIDPTRIITAGRGEHTDHLPANGRTVTFVACQPGKPGETASAAEAQAATGEVAPPPPAPPMAETPPPAPAPEVYPVTTPTNPSWGSAFGFALMAGGQFNDFTNSDMRSRTNGGGGWDARFIAGTKSFVGLEGAYVGGARDIQTLGITANRPLLVNNGLEGSLRVNVPLTYGNSLFEPYGTVGLGWQHYSISNYNTNTGVLSDFTASDNVMTVPLKAGFAYAYQAFIADVNGTYTPTYYNNLLVSNTGSGTLNNWGIGGQVGFMF